MGFVKKSEVFYMGFIKKSEVFCVGFVKKSEVFAWVLQKRQPSHIKRMTAFFDNSILSDKKMLYFLISSGNTGMAPFCVQT